MDVLELESQPFIQDLRKRVSDFVEKHVYPNEKAFDGDNWEASGSLKSIQAEAKKQGLWALGLPKDIGGGGLPFMPYVFVNEIVGRSELAMVGLGTHTAQDGTMLYLYGSPELKKRFLLPMVNGDIYPC